MLLAIIFLRLKITEHDMKNVTNFNYYYKKSIFLTTHQIVCILNTKKKYLNTYSTCLQITIYIMLWNALDFYISTHISMLLFIKYFYNIEFLWLDLIITTYIIERVVIFVLFFWWFIWSTQKYLLKTLLNEFYLLLKWVTFLKGFFQHWVCIWLGTKKNKFLEKITNL